MSTKTVISVLLVATFLIAAVAIYTRRPDPVPNPPPTQIHLGPLQPAPKPRLPAPRFSPMPTEEAQSQRTEIVASPSQFLQPTNSFARLLKDGEVPHVRPEQLDPYLRQNRRSAESLLAAFRLLDDKALLREALENYPHDPRVNFAALSALKNDMSPEEYRQRLEAFKQAAPDNALANYLSARNYFKSGQTDQAVQELLAASSKPKYQDYSADTLQNIEEAYRSAGCSEVEAKVAATYGM